MADFVHINKDDNVIVMLRPATAGDRFELEGNRYTAREDIPQGHKMAVCAMKPGDPVEKYGFPIGHATEDIAVGAWWREHNMKTNH